MVELKRSSVMQRLAGWMPTAIRGEQSPGDLALSLAVRELEEDTFIFALCQDHKLRMWSYRVSTSLSCTHFVFLSFYYASNIVFFQVVYILCRLPTQF